MNWMMGEDADKEAPESDRIMHLGHVDALNAFLSTAPAPTDGYRHDDRSFALELARLERKTDLHTEDVQAVADLARHIRGYGPHRINDTARTVALARRAGT